MPQLETLRFYATPEHPCSYLAGESAKTVFLDPDQTINSETFQQLSDLGFRRSGSHIYRPHCDKCQACISIRVATADFKLSNSQKRIMKKNSDLTMTIVKPLFTEEYYNLYEKYINLRHLDGDMYPPSKDQFNSFLVSAQPFSFFIEYRDSQQKLLGISVMDALDNGLSAVYTFFDPNEHKRSLGTFAILWQIMQNNQRNLAYLYLGYWVKNCAKMDYKIKFKPVELLIQGQWRPIK